MFSLFKSCFNWNLNSNTVFPAAPLNALEEREKVLDVKMTGNNSFSVEKMILQERIGKGTTCIVYKGIQGEKMVACKQYALEYYTYYDNEKSRLEELDHPNIVKLIGSRDYVPRQRSLFLVLEYGQNGDLDQYLQTHRGNARDRVLLHQVSIDIIKGLMYLHSLGIIHRDIKASNILLDSEWKAMISDFDLAVKLRKNQRVYNTDGVHAGTYSWSAPEINDYGITTAYDIYPYGWLLWVMSSQNQNAPFRNANTLEDIKEAQKYNNYPSVPKTVPPATKTIIRQCWSWDPSRRPTAEQIHATLTQNPPRTLEKNSCLFSPFK